MIELPEAYTIASQMNETICGKVIAEVIRGNSPHKFAFYNREPEEYVMLMEGMKVGRAMQNGPLILLEIGSEHIMVLGDGGEKIFYHENEKTLPKKHQFLLHFEDGTYLTVNVQGWGFLQLVDKALIGEHEYAGRRAVSPLSDEFTYEYFTQLFDAGAVGSNSAKAFLINKPGVWGIGNGCLQDILFRAKIHPKRKVVEMNPEEKRQLYNAVIETLRQMTEMGGRDTEYDLYGQQGGYPKILDSKSLGQPCPECHTPFTKISYLGGTCYFCPECQQ